MLRKLTCLSVALIVCSNPAFAYHHKHHKHQPAPVSYKGEETAPVAAPVVENMFDPAWYLGASIGSRLNYTSSPSVYNGLEGTLFGGYGGVIDNNFYLAGELNVGDSIVMTNHSSSAGSARSTWDAALSILPGWMLTQDTLGYFRAGLGWTDFSAPSTNSFTGILGLGMQVALCKNWDVRGEYQYSFYRNMSIGTPRSQAVNLGLMYRFL